jgi:dienelactone hydrolase
MKNKKKIVLWLTLALVLFFTIGFVTLKNLAYPPSSIALQTATDHANYTVETTSDVVYFKPKKEMLPISIVFYQGALVNQESYSIWASNLATEGYPVYLVHHPFNLAITSKDKAQTIINEYPINDYVIGGHSLGGVMASRYAHDKESNSSIDEGSLKGVFFFASYPDEKGSLDNSDLAVLSVTGSNDGVINLEAYTEGKKFLPKKTLYKSIQGGNHAGFGSYGPQKGDYPATISNKQQQEELTSTFSSWLDTIKK